MSENKKSVNWNKLIRLFLFLFAAFSPISLAGANVSLTLALLCWAAKTITDRNFKIQRTPLNLPLVIFVLAVGISVLASTHFHWSLKKYDSMWMVSIFFLAANNITDKNQLKKILAILIIFTVIAGINGIVEHFTRVNIMQVMQIKGGEAYKWLKETPPRSSGSFNHPVKFGMYLIMIMPIIFALILHAKERRRRYWLAGAFIITFFALIYTYSRGCWIALFFAMVFLGIFVLGIKKFIIGFTGSLVIITLFLLLFPGSSFTRRAKTMVDFKFNTANVERIAGWNRGLRMISDYPVFGVGWQRAGQENKRYIKGNEKPFNYVHNVFLNMAVETGLTGLGIFLWVFLVIFVAGIYIFKKVKDKYLKTVTCGILTSIFAFVASGMVDYPFSAPLVILLLYFLTGVLFAIPRIEGGN